MKTIEIQIVKKNRKYFACNTKGYKCKLVIDKNSEGLELGKHTLVVKDRSKKTKYGTELIFELYSDAESQKEAGIVTLTHKYNSILVDKCRNLGGRFDKGGSTWVFPDIVADKIEELDFLYNSKRVAIEIEADDDISQWHGPVAFLGYTIAVAWGRDSGARLGDDISCIYGTYDSGGSVKNWTTRISKSSVFRLSIPEELLKLHNYEDPEWTIKKLGRE